MLRWAVVSGEEASNVFGIPRTLQLHPHADHEIPETPQNLSMSKTATPQTIDLSSSPSPPHSKTPSKSSHSQPQTSTLVEASGQTLSTTTIPQTPLGSQLQSSPRRGLGILSGPTLSPAQPTPTRTGNKRLRESDDDDTRPKSKRVGHP